MIVETHQNGDPSINPPEDEKLWPRFVKVRRSIKASFTEDRSPDFERTLDTFSWSGVDAGIHDHKGRFKGSAQGVRLDITFNGTTTMNNPEIVTDSDGEWRIIHKNRQHINIQGFFQSQDGLDGVLSLNIEDGKLYIQVYWLTCMNIYYRLEQVVNPDGVVFNAKKLVCSRRGEIIIPGTRVDVPKNTKKIK